MKKEYFKPEIEVIKLTSEGITTDGTVTRSSTQLNIYTLNFKNNTVNY